MQPSISVHLPATIFSLSAPIVSTTAAQRSSISGSSEILFSQRLTAGSEKDHLLPIRYQHIRMATYSYSSNSQTAARSRPRKYLNGSAQADRNRAARSTILRLQLRPAVSSPYP